MFSKPVLYTIIALFLLLGFGQLAWHCAHLPDQVASHFDAGGEPDGFMSKFQYVLLQAGLLIGLPVIVLGSGFLSAALPSSMVNIPNRDFWLHPDRKQETLSYVQTTLAWITIATQGFLMVVSQLSFEANVRAGRSLSMTGFFVAMGVYLALIAVCCIVLMRRFKIPSGEAVS